LSHSWGGLQLARLERKSLESFMSRMPEDELTKTIRDAIWITQGLGLRYLWVDSVCIIQDSTQDWDKESASMASVYGGSTINIAASGAKDGSWGCFLKPPGFIGKVHVEATRDDITKAWDIAPSLFYSSVVKGHLSSRGWALQERILAPRTLHFTDTELFWECKLVNARESFPEGLHEFENQHVFHLDRKPISEVWHTVSALVSPAQPSLGSRLGWAQLSSRLGEGRLSKISLRRG
jgi:hypothetical protein